MYITHMSENVPEEPNSLSEDEDDLCTTDFSNASFYQNHRSLIIHIHYPRVCGRTYVLYAASLVSLRTRATSSVQWRNSRVLLLSKITVDPNLGCLV